ncbi:MAG: nitrate transporter [Nitrospirales bacterium]|nr:MAG: nitrate transporter [Nitrospirales bacterium]
MISKGIRALQSGYWPSLVGAWLHFEVSFMVWVLIGALGIAISEEFALSATQKGFLVAIPLLGGGLLRIVIGPMVDQYGPKRIGLLVLACECAALVFVWLFASTYFELLCVGLFLGFAGASFAVALPLASQAYPAAHQGLAMGVAAIGNSGVLLATLLAPRLAHVVGWRNTFGLMVIPVIVTAIVFWCTVVSPEPTRGRSDLRSALQLLRNAVQQKFMYWLCFLYGVTFGGFIGLASFFPIFFHDQYQIDMIEAGTMTAFCGLAGSVARPIGGHLADRYGGTKLLQMLFPVVALVCIGLAQLLSPVWTYPLSISALLLLGFGNGVVFQVAATRFQHSMGTASGLIGAAGAMGGFLLPSWFGILKDLTGTFSFGFWGFACMASLAGLSVLFIHRSNRFPIHQESG